MRHTSISMIRFDGHLYALLGFGRGQDWTGINTHVQTQFEGGASDWHLATVSDAQENAALASLVRREGIEGAAFGLIQDPASAEPGGGWGWVTGESLGFVSWLPGEPNNAPLGPTNAEDYGQIYYTGFWNDIYDTFSHRHALAELDTSRAIALDGTGSRDRLLGGDFGDELRGLGGNDTLRGGVGDDTLSGGDGDDVLGGGNGADVLAGDAGADTFRFATLEGAGRRPGDRVQDFQQGLDLIDVSPIDADTADTSDQAFFFIGDAAFSGTAGELRADIFGSDATRVSGDVDGDGAADFVVTLTGILALTAADFAL